jgi:hypothetical protein
MMMYSNVIMSVLVFCCMGWVWLSFLALLVACAELDCSLVSLCAGPRTFPKSSRRCPRVTLGLMLTVGWTRMVAPNIAQLGVNLFFFPFQYVCDTWGSDIMIYTVKGPCVAKTRNHI